ncbi:hypothetical protein I5U36_01615 [Stenotrophomonas maltophilia]|nr:hypothetical protein [Stenotrophomonas maltophilia]MBH1436173.1 hypothetical protein [Stenotrophomonas maltophilia]
MARFRQPGAQGPQKRSSMLHQTPNATPAPIG